MPGDTPCPTRYQLFSPAEGRIQGSWPPSAGDPGEGGGLQDHPAQSGSGELVSHTPTESGTLGEAAESKSASRVCTLLTGPPVPGGGPVRGDRLAPNASAKAACASGPRERRRARRAVPGSPLAAAAGTEVRTAPGGGLEMGGAAREYGALTM